MLQNLVNILALFVIHLNLMEASGRYSITAFVKITSAVNAPQVEKTRQMYYNGWAEGDIS
jgi:hypothetical protein